MLEQFIKDTEGKYIDIDGAYGSQCWDYSGYYAKVVCGCPSFPTGNGLAIGVFNNFLNPLPKYFTKVSNNPNDPNQYPPVGAIVFWTYNHTGVVIASDSRLMTTLEQDGANDPNQDGIADGVVYRITRGYQSVAGWFIPKVNVLEEDYMKATANDLKYLYLGVYAEALSDDTLAKDGFIGTDMGVATMRVLDYANKNNIAYWQVKPKLEKQIADLTVKNIELENRPPKEIIKEVTVIKEVPIGFDKLTFGELISAAFKKLFNLK